MKTIEGVRPAQVVIGVAGVIAITTVLVAQAIRGTGYIWGALILAALSTPPWILYVALARSRLGRIAIPLLLLTATGIVYFLVLRSDSSTAGFGYFVSIVINLFIVGLGSVREIWILNRSSRRLPLVDDTASKRPNADQ